MTSPQLSPVTTLDPDIRRDFDAAAADIGDHPETAFTERHAHAVLTSWLSKHQFAIETVPGLSTAFVARAGDSAPTVALLLEYDALPGIGHGCGHQLIAAGGAAAAIQSARLRGGAGTILAIGCPAEESGAGKAHLVKKGVFTAVDAAMMFHPASATLLARSSLAATTVAVEFHGRSAHAAKSPERGRNALTSMTQMFTAIDAFRPRMGRWGHINGIITDGGQATNVIPEYTRAEFMIRGATRTDVNTLVGEVRAMADGAAMATGTSTTVVQSGPLYAERRNNRTLLRALRHHMYSTGLKIDRQDVDESVGSSDVGNVSLAVPTIHPTVSITEKVLPSHTVDFANAARQGLASDRAAAMARALADLAVDVIHDPALRRSVRDEFMRGGFDAPGVDFSGIFRDEPAMKP